MSRYRVFLDSFGEGLDELPKRQQASDEAVLRHLHAAGRFSVFEVTDTLGRTLERLLRGTTNHHGSRKPLLEVAGGEYPWTNVRLTDGALALIGVTSSPEGAR